MFLYFIGLATIAYFVFQVLKEIYKCLQPFPDLQKRYGKGCWAVVTGATDGIGKGYCQIFAKQGVNVVLIARNEQKAKDVVQELSAGSSSQFKIVLADFTKSHEPNFFEKIVAQIDKLDIGILVNNVGVCYVAPFEKLRDKDIYDTITVNCFPTILLTKLLIPVLKNRKRSAVINLSSFTACTVFPYNSLYSATKVFDDFFSRAFALEIPNIDVLAHRPLYVTTAMSRFMKGEGAISPYACAWGGLQRLGLDYASHGHWFHRLLGTIMMWIPEYPRTWLIKQNVKKIAMKYK